MDSEGRDRLLRSAWELDPLGDRVLALSEISERIGPDRRRSVALVGRVALHVEEPRRRRTPGLLGPGRRGDDAAGKGRAAAGAPSPARPRPPDAGGLRPRLRNKRQDDHGIDDRRDSAQGRPRRRPTIAPDPTRHWGVATAMLEQRGEIGVFEVDEAWLPILAMELAPRAIVLGNLFRDRLDGYGELDALATAWRKMLTGGVADDRSCSTPTMPSSQAWGRPLGERPAPDLSSSASRIALRACRRPSRRPTRSAARPATSRSSSMPGC